MENLIIIVISVFIPTQLFMMKQVSDLKKQIAKLCERITKEETKNDIYHEK